MAYQICGRRRCLGITTTRGRHWRYMAETIKPIVKTGSCRVRNRRSMRCDVKTGGSMTNWILEVVMTDNGIGISTIDASGYRIVQLRLELLFAGQGIVKSLLSYSECRLHVVDLRLEVITFLDHV